MDIAGLSGRVGLRFNFLNLGAFPMEHGALGCHAGWQKCGMAWAAAGLFQGRPATAVAYCGCCAASSVGLRCAVGEKGWCLLVVVRRLLVKPVHTDYSMCNSCAASPSHRLHLNSGSFLYLCTLVLVNRHQS